MATLDSIRKRSGLLIIVIGLAMAAFILTDFLSNGNILFAEDTSMVGSVDGESISITEMNAEMDRLRSADQAYANQTPMQLANVVWQDKLRAIIMGEKYDELGFAVTSKELYDQIIENPNIRQGQAFQNPQTGAFDPSLFNRALANLRDNAGSSPEAAAQWNSWLAFENDVRNQALSFKFNGAVEKAIYTPQAIARQAYRYQSVTHDVGFVQFPYTAVADADVEVTEADYEAYYNEHKPEFKQDFETRDILYVNFAIAPSEQDQQEVRDELADLIEPTVRVNANTGVSDTLPGFSTTDDDSTFVLLNSSLPFRPGYWREGELSGNIDSIMHNAEVGYIYGPYEEAGGYKLSKLLDIRYLPDSVEARHILITTQSERNPQGRPVAEAQAIADSLYEYLQANPGQFAEVAETQSEDPGSGAEGGDLGWFGPRAMVTPFSNYCFNNEVGEMGVVQSQFGFHIIEIQDQAGSSKAVKVATIYREVNVSRRTVTAIYDEAAAFANSARSGDFSAVADSMGYVARPMTDLQESAENIIGLNQARPVVTWAFGKERDVTVGDVSLIDNNGTAYVVAKLTDIAEEGYQSLDRVRERIQPMVVNRAKAEILMERAQEAMTGLNNIQAIANNTEYNMNLQQVRLATPSITGVGNEPKIVGLMCGTPVGEVRGPEAGNRGVYIWQTNSISDFADKGDYSSDAETSARTKRSRVNGQLFNALMKKSEIIDNRIRFF